MPLMDSNLESKQEKLSVFDNIPLSLHDATNSIIKCIEVIEKEGKTGNVNEYYSLTVDHLGKELTFEVYKGGKGKPQFGGSLDAIKAYIDSQHDEIVVTIGGKKTFIPPHKDSDNWINKQITIAKYPNRYGFEPIFHLPKKDASTQVGSQTQTLVDVARDLANTKPTPPLPPIFDIQQALKEYLAELTPVWVEWVQKNMPKRYYVVGNNGFYGYDALITNPSSLNYELLTVDHAKSFQVAILAGNAPSEALEF